MPNLSLWLENYDDIYSDFDSRYYLKRRISEDFLHELRLVRKYRNEKVTELLLFLPPQARRDESERIIVNSLRDFFSGQFHDINEKYKVKLNSGIALLIGGLAIMTVNSFITLRSALCPFLSIARLILEPGGWFLLWAGFDFLFYDLREIKTERRFLRELSGVNIHFRSA